MALWNFTIPDTSPIFTYPDGVDLRNGWQTFYSGSGFNTQPGESPEGDSSHVTMLPSAELSLDFYGIGIYLYGQMNASYEVVLDNDVHSMEGNTGLLYGNQNLTEEIHSLTLRAKASSDRFLLGFAQAQVTVSDRQMPTQVFHDNSDSVFSYSGIWTTNTVADIPNSSVTAPFHQTLDFGASVTMNFSRAGTVAVHGSTNFGHGLYSVSLDNEAPKTYNGSTFWLVADTLLYLQSGLDPNSTHHLNITNLSGGGKLTLSSVITYEDDTISTSSAQSPSSTLGSAPKASASSRTGSSHSAKIAKIAAPIAIAGVLLICVLLLLIWRIRSRKRRESLEATITPLVLPERSHSYAELNSIHSNPNLISASSKRQRILAPPAPLLAPPPVTQPTVSPPAGSNPLSPSSPADVNQIIELIAQRIDRRERGQERRESGTLPPGYRVNIL
ncbi:hypothetical protein R3P38DRAFT_3317360 [Favolaschia claudopus]|uniref:Transmembrane protein n=1 Tax=Favolaschia claudopus TaxID=2862362 RepID=A0AAW0BAI7_9AGAR